MEISRVLVLTLFSLWVVVPVGAQDHRASIDSTEDMCTIDVGSTLVIRSSFTIPKNERCLSRFAPHQIDSGETLCRFCRGAGTGKPAVTVALGDYAVTAVSCGLTAMVTVQGAGGANYELTCGNDFRDPRSIQNFINAWSRPGHPGPFFRGTVTRSAAPAASGVDAPSGASAVD